MRLTRMLPAVAVVLVILSGCTFVGPAEHKAEVEPYSIEMGAVVASLGEVPEGEPMTPERTADFITRFLDQQWGAVSASYPDALRPVVAVESTGDDAGNSYRACLAATTGTIREKDMSNYACSARFPSVPSGMLTADQAGYLYDYWTLFVMPCYTAHGYAIETDPPDRARFIAQWPFQNWAPIPTEFGETIILEARDELEQFCPPTLDELN